MKRKEHQFPSLLQQTPPPASSIQDAFSVLINNTEQVYILVDTDCKIRLFNSIAYERAALSHLHLEVGRSVFELVPPGEVESLRQLYQKVFGGEKIAYEKRYDVVGKPRYFTISFMPARDERGRTVGVLITANDITEKKLKQQELELSEERWRFALEGSNQGMWDWNVLTGEVYFSASWKKLFGYTDDNDIRKIEEWRSIAYTRKTSRWWKKNLSNHFQSNNPHFESVYRFKSKNNGYRWLLARGMVLEKDGNNNPVRMIGTHTDITDMRLLEESYKTLFDANPLPSWTYCLDSGRFMDVNEAALKLYGYSRAEFLSMTISELGMQNELSLEKQEVTHLGGQHFRQHRKKDGDVIIVNITGDIIQKNNIARGPGDGRRCYRKSSRRKKITTIGKAVPYAFSQQSPASLDL